ncbi:DUF1681-domain-containing protein [Hypoxylon trugodes]|uniref:DUF1681-domain-containing protein n=1 Tax=Hypoxylon trugodes TaxID=326681 RepID=UPI002193A61F|nr:DUF1681-domain-containing protein [Hypoxylon trugodes]KAI1386291.1 DUF1681-domain-containing protein [Hypoxylon trugodes]
METIDPATGRPLPDDALQRVLFVAGQVHVYNIPPMVPGKGHVAASWTSDASRQIFTARLRVVETAFTISATGPEEEKELVKADVVLEDPSTGGLFAAAPYTGPAVVESVSDSSRFFALRVQDEAGRKATLGIGFEERSEAFDFGVALQEAQKSVGWGGSQNAGKKQAAAEKQDNAAEKRDLSLKEGETITINLPGRFGRRKPEPPPQSNEGLSSFSLPPPPSFSASPGPGGVGILPPPPPTTNTNSRAKRLSAQNLGFDDGKFGEFA